MLTVTAVNNAVGALTRNANGFGGFVGRAEIIYPLHTQTDPKQLVIL